MALAATPTPNIAGKTVLLVDDDPEVRATMRRLLEQDGLAVLQASDGRSAIEIAKQYPGMIDLLLTDVVMPGMNCIELMWQLQLARPDLRSILMTGHTEDPFVRKTIASHPYFLLKPISRYSLTEMIRRALA